MKWKGRRQSTNVEDRRSARGPALAGGGLLTLVIVIGAMLLGADPQMVMNLLGGVQQQNQQQGPPPANGKSGEKDELAQFVSVVLADTEDVWEEQFRKIGRRYEKPTLVLFRDSVRSACGFQQSATGPFYCPPDQKVYIDLSFYNELKNRLGAPGDFAQAYVIAHEVGHHVQNLLGISDDVHRKQQRAGKEAANRLSVQLELQADYFAGVWAHHAQQNWQILEPGDIDEAIRAAAAIGDDKLQQDARGYVRPESFTHGTSEQRVRWFTRGLKSGDMEGGDTFRVKYEDL
ncbi:MAG: neutral zinc metallopeptidase [Pirellulales bacterium]|nr:neutral zinc metallopeptidase [Pirellulales bacterium]